MPGMPRSCSSVRGRAAAIPSMVEFVQHDIGRYAARAGDLRTPRPKRAEQVRITGFASVGWRRGKIAAPGFGPADAKPGARRLLAQHHLGLALQDAARGVCQFQRAKGFRVGLEVTERHQLADNGAPLFFIEFAADAEHRYPVMPELLDAFGQAADQNIDQMHGAKALSGAIGTGQQLLRDHLLPREAAAARGSCRNCRICPLSDLRRNIRAGGRGGNSRFPQGQPAPPACRSTPA